MTTQINKEEIDNVIKDLEGQGINNSSADMDGLGDLIESTLTKFGITQERFKSWFNLKECGCTKRKQWLNKILPFGKKE